MRYGAPSEAGGPRPSCRGWHRRRPSALTIGSLERSSSSCARTNPRRCSRAGAFSGSTRGMAGRPDDTHDLRVFVPRLSRRARGVPGLRARSRKGSRSTSSASISENRSHHGHPLENRDIVDRDLHALDQPAVAAGFEHRNQLQLGAAEDSREQPREPGVAALPGRRAPPARVGSRRSAASAASCSSRSRTRRRSVIPARKSLRSSVS